MMRGRMKLSVKTTKRNSTVLIIVLFLDRNFIALAVFCPYKTRELIS